MKPLTSFISIAVLSMMLMAPLSADDVVNVEGRVVEANPSALESTSASLHLNSLPMRAARGVSSQADVVLPPLTAQERSYLRQADGDNEMGLRIGVGRDIPDSLGSPNSWNWVAVDGGKVAHLGVTSIGAVRTRVQLQLAELPEGVELRFFSPTDSATVYGPVTRTELAHQPKDAEGKTLFWSPSVAGDTLKLEVFLPDKVQPSDMQLTITRLSHVVLDPMSGKTQGGVLEANTAACYLDIACQTPKW
jgi:lysyl endopeptidase